MKPILFLFFIFPSLALAEKPLIVVSFSILANLCEEIGADNFQIETAIPTEADAHGFEPKPETLKQMKAAQAIVLNGLGFEPWFPRIQKSLKPRGRILIASEGIEALKFQSPHEHDHETHEESHVQDSSVDDPHAWQSPVHGLRYAENIKKLFIQLQPFKKNVIEKRFQSFKARVEKVISSQQKRFLRLKNKTVITPHASFNYMGQFYQLDFRSPVGISTDNEISAKDLKKSIQMVRKEKIQALFLEEGSSNQIIETLSRETKVKISGTLYGDRLSNSDGPAFDYISLLESNADLVFKTLSSTK